MSNKIAPKSAIVVVMMFAFGPRLWAEEVQWRHDYAAARRDAEKTGRPLLLDFGTEGCSWCRKLDLTTFRSAAVVRLTNERLIPVKIDAEQSERLTQAMGVQSFPTIIIALHDGKILKRQEGYLDAAELRPMLENVLAKLPQSNPKESIASDQSSSDVPMTRCRVVIVTAADSSRENRGQDSERVQRAQNLLDQARHDLEAGLSLSCMERCGVLNSEYADLPQSAEAKKMLEQLAADSDAIGRTRSRLDKILADAYVKRAEDLRTRGDVASALACLEQACQICPESSEARAALAQLKQERAKLAATRPSDPVIPTPDQ